MKVVIEATSWNGTQFYYNSDKGIFEQADMVDIYRNDHFDANEEQLILLSSAKERAAIEGLKNVRLLNVEAQ